MMYNELIVSGTSIICQKRYQAKKLLTMNVNEQQDGI